MAEIWIDDYLQNFSGERRKEALKYAHDIRKFEIELYWKRATYFWTFIGAAFAGYFALQRDGDIANDYVVTCLGLLFSLGWYLVNRGSGSWQRNWEKHVDLLEDAVTGPLYKTLIDRRSYKFFNLAEPYSFSPSRINNILALSVIFIWIVLIGRTLWKAKGYLPITVPNFLPGVSGTILAMTALTITFAIFLLAGGMSRRHDPSKSLRFNLRVYNQPTHPPSTPQ
jgi:hypothetical protein